MKTILVSLALAGLVIGCSKTSVTKAVSNPPQFRFTAKDLASPAVVATNQTGTIVVRFKLADTKARALQAFSTAHLNQPCEVLFGSNVIAKPVIRSVISNGEIEESFAASASRQAHAIADLLNRN